jgi:serine/threonine protein kinase/tetratricopeptide (TPR) repeat protein
VSPDPSDGPTIPTPGDDDWRVFEHPDNIGPYRLLQVIGEGGTGVVYEAEQTEPIRRRVALKMMKLGMDTKVVIARFEAERQALAVMDHPSIAKVLDAGVSEAGRPYFVMEHVKGVPVNEFCDAGRLSTNERLKLFIQICQAVQHAHQKGVIHRDLKPSNVLVAEQDGVPLPKIIDFGLAKAIGQRLTDKTLVTVYGVAMGTPAYMSPEQAEMSGLDVDTRTDIYSLGVMLYELLVGSLPIDPATVGLPGFIAQLVLRETDPLTPSSRLGSLGEELEYVAKQRRTDPSTLKRQLHRDLDWITMKALEKDRTRRYETPNALALDLERHIAAEPVLARPPSPWYRAGRFVRRHRLGVAVSVASIGLLISVVVLTLVQSARIARERDRAEQEAAKATAVNAFLQETLGSANPYYGTGRQVTLLDALAGAAEKIEASFANQPEIEAALQHTLGQSYFELGQYSEAEPLLRTALETREEILGTDHPDVFETLTHLGWLLVKLDRLGEADTVLRKALDVARSVYGEEHQEVATALASLGWLEDSRGNYEEAERLDREVLAMRLKLLGEEHQDVAESMSSLGWVLQNQGELDEAEELYRRALVVDHKLLGAEHPAIAMTMNNLAWLLNEKGDLDGAEELFRGALAMRRKLLGDAHLEITHSLNGLARVKHGKGELDQAEALYLEALEMTRELVGERHRDVALNLSTLAWIRSDRGDLEGSVELYEQVLEMQRELLGNEHLNVAVTLANMGMNLDMMGDFSRAKSLFEEALRIHRKSSNADDWHLANSQSHYGTCLTHLGLYEQAEANLLAAQEVLQANLGKEHTRTRRNVRRLVELYEAWGKPDKAAEYRTLLEEQSEDTSSLY